MVSELENYQQRIDDLCGQINDLLTGLPPEALNWRPIEGTDDHATNSLAVLATHVAGAIHFWIAEVVGGQPPTRDREAEFRVEASSASELCEMLAKAGAEAREVFAALEPADLAGVREIKGRTVPVRWGIIHVIDHTALHLGHMQLTYQLWRGGPGTQAPRWFERLP